MSYTITLEPDVVRTAEACASRRGTTLNSLIRAYLVSFVREEDALAGLHVVPEDSVVGALSGVMRPSVGSSDKDLVSEAILAKYDALA